MAVKIGLIILAFLFLGFIVCTNHSHTYPFKQETEKIEKIELILQCPDKDNESIIIDSDAIPSFVKDFKELTCKKRLSPLDYYGEYVIVFHYNNGDADIVGSHSNGYILQGKETVHGWYYFAEEDLQLLFKKWFYESK